MIGFSVETAVKECTSAHYRKVCVAILSTYVPYSDNFGRDNFGGENTTFTC